MTYGLTARTLDNGGFVPIDCNEFSEIRLARDGLLTALGIEEKFDLLIENYAEYEIALLSISTDHMLHANGQSWCSAIGNLHVVNRRLSNLLTTARLYIDHVRHDMNNLSRLGLDCGDVLDSSASTEYDRSLV